MNAEGKQLIDQTKDTTPYIVTIDENNGDAVISLSGNASNKYSMTNGQDGIIVITHVGAIATSMNFLITINDAKRSRDLSNGPIHANTILGNEGRLFKLSQPIILDKNQTLFCTITDLSGSSNTIRLFFIGTKFYREVGTNQNTFPCFFTTDSSIQLSSGSSGIYYVTLSRGKNFLLDRILAYCSGVFKFRITDLRRGLMWGSSWISSEALASAQYNETLGKWFLYDNSKLKIEVMDLSNATNNIYFTFAGVELNN